MKARKISLLALGLCLPVTARAQTADDYVAWGRASLSATNIVAANTAFHNAVALEPTNQTANVFYAATRLLVLPGQPAGSNFMSRLGLPVEGRDIYNWTARLPVDTNGVPFAPVDMSAAEFSALLRTNVLAAIQGADANLALVTDTNFLLTLRASETRLTDVTLDYGDIQMLRAMLQAAEYCLYTACSWNLDAQLSAIHSLYDSGTLSIGRVLMDNSDLLTFATTNDLAAARATFEGAVDRYLAASEIIRNRSPILVRLFNYDPNMAEQEQAFRISLLDLVDSLDDAVPLSLNTNYVVFFGAQFSGTHSVRGLLPDIVGNGYVLGSLPDPTFGGAIQGIDAVDVDNFLRQLLEPVPSIDPLFSLGGGKFSFPLHVLKGRGYVVQASTNLTEWSDVMAFVGVSDIYPFSDPFAPGDARRFYRLVDRTEAMPDSPNDNFADRIPLAGLGIVATGYAANTSREPGEPGITWLNGTAWWSWTAPSSGPVVVSTAGSVPATSARIYVGNSLGNLSYVADSDQVFDGEAGVTYQVQVYEGWTPPVGIRLTVTAPPVLDILSPIDGTMLPGPTNLPVRVSATDTDGNINLLEVYADGLLLGRIVGDTFDQTWSIVSPGIHFLTVIATDNLGVTTSSQLRVTAAFAVANDNFADRSPIPGTPATILGSNFGATKETGEPDHAGITGGHSVWWSWTAPSNGVYFISAALTNWWGTFERAPLGVYTSDSITNLTSVASNTAPGYGYLDLARLDAMAGTNYEIAVDGYSGHQGSVILEVKPLVEQPLELGVPAYYLSGGHHSWTYYRVSVPVGAPSLQVRIFGGNGDCDLYVRASALPDLLLWDYSSGIEGNVENLTISNPEPGDWHILLYGYDSYSGLTLLAQ